MRSFSRWSALLLILLFSAAILAPGCANFKSHKRMDLTPFAENMIEMAGDIQYGLAQEKVVYLRNYIDIPETAELEVYLNKIRAVMRGSIAYSIEIVTLSSSTLTGPEQCEALADYLDELLRPAITAPVPPLHFTIGEFDTMLQNTREQTKLLDALSMTQPIVNEIARIISEILDDANLAVDAAYYSIGDALDENNVDPDKWYRDGARGPVECHSERRIYRENTGEAIPTHSIHSSPCSLPCMKLSVIQKILPQKTSSP